MSGALSWIAPLVNAGASVYGAYSANQAGQQQQRAAQQASQVQANATNQASQLQANTAQQQMNLLAQMYNQNRDDQAPYRAAGQAGLDAYAQNLSQPFQQTPGYQFAQNEGMRAVMANQAAARNVNSGATLRALQDRGMGIADQTYGQYMNRLAALSGMGQTAVGQGQQAANSYGQTGSSVLGQNASALGQYGLTGAQQQNNYLTQGTGAAAGGQVSGANALIGGANNLLSYYMGGR
jgi:hypothetical protein